MSRFMRFPSRRSVVYSTGGMVACTQPLAVEAGQRILALGGNAADAAVAVAAALGVTEPASTGIGGDVFALFYDARTRRVHAVNGSGRSPRNSTLRQLRGELNIPAGVSGAIPMRSAFAVTVPGAPAGWIDTVKAYGSGNVSMKQILDPAVQLCEGGFPVSEISAWLWKDAEVNLRNAPTDNREVLKTDGPSGSLRAPRPGELFLAPGLGKTFTILAEEGKKGFYTGPVAEAIVNAVQSGGGHLELSDLAEHMKRGSEFTEPISSLFLGQRAREQGRLPLEIWEHAPNGQGIVVLMALGILEALEKTGDIPRFEPQDHNSTAYLHALIESLSIAFADARWWVSDPNHGSVDVRDLLSKPYLANRAKMFNPDKAGLHLRGRQNLKRGVKCCDTVYLAVADREGNAISMVNSLYGHFGSCLVPRGYGFALQARGAGFELGPEDHPNAYQGGKRPYHTIIPALITRGNACHRELASILGVMGGFMQPQGHVQVLLNLEAFMMDPQEALDAPRFCIGGDRMDATISLEEGITSDVAKELSDMGHNVHLLDGWSRGTFGRGQVIKRQVDWQSGQTVYSAGSDPRGDGCAMPCL